MTNPFAFLLILSITMISLQSQPATDLPDGTPRVLPEISVQQISNVAEYYSIAGSKGNSLVVLYEQWCGYSQVTLKLLEELRKNQEFLKTKVFLYPN